MRGLSLSYEVINRMDEDELRNYICHLRETMEALGELNQSKDDLIMELRAANAIQEKIVLEQRRLNEYDNLMSRVEDELRRKYSDSPMNSNTN